MMGLQKNEGNNEWCNNLAQLKTYLKYKTTSQMFSTKATNHQGPEYQKFISWHIRLYKHTQAFVTVYFYSQTNDLSDSCTQVD